MTLHTKMTTKGQITIPKKIRDLLHLEKDNMLLVDFDPKKQEVVLRPQPDIVDIAGTMKPRKNKKARVTNARKAMEETYDRS